MRDDHERARETDEEKERREPLARRVLHEEPTFDQDEGLDDEDKAIADSFPASDPPAH
jgi:hypothetical protein